jgi:type VI secretion system protein ImpL
MLARFELAQRIRERYFPPNEMRPRMDFRVTSFMVDDQNTSRFVLEIDGRAVPYQFGPDPNVAMVWPGPSPGRASVTWEERGGARPFLAYQGPWAWQRLIDAAEVQSDRDDVRYGLTWRRGNHTATVRLEASSVRNPIGKTDVQQFRCG